MRLKAGALRDLIAPAEQVHKQFGLTRQVHDHRSEIILLYLISCLKQV